MASKADNKHFAIGISIAALLIAGLCLNLHELPIGTFFWDQLVIDNASYVFDRSGSPFVPPLPASSIFFYWLASHFPTHPNPLLGGQVLFAILLFPALLAACIRQTPRKTALVIIPYLLFAFAPFHYEGFFYRNTVMHNVVYNREGAIALYVLVALLQTVRWRLRFIPIAYSLFFLLFSKPNFALAGLILVVLWGASAKHRFRELLAVFGSLILVVGPLLITTHSVLPYFFDVFSLVAAGSGGAGNRLATIVFYYSQLSLGMGLLAFALVLHLINRAREARRSAQWYLSARAFVRCNRTTLFLLALIIGAYIVESQNTGSWYFYYVWPAALSALNSPLANQTRFAVPKVSAYVGTAAVFSALWIQAIFRTTLFLSTLTPGIPTTTIYHANYHTYVLNSKVLKQGRQVYMVQELVGAHEKANAHNDYDYSDVIQSTHPAWSVAYLISLQSAEENLRKILNARPVDKRRILVLAFSDPFTKALGLVPYQALPTCLDASRISLQYRAAAIQDVSLSTDAIIVSNCGMSSSKGMMHLIHKNALRGRHIVQLNECWAAYVKD